MTIPLQPSLQATLPGRYYTDPAIFEQEQTRIFGAMWVCVGRADAMPQSGDYTTVDLAQENVLIIRGRDRILRAFLNVCRHRGARLCSDPAGHLSGSVHCRYHAWSYDWDGALVGAPQVMSLPDFDRAQFGLVPVALALHEGLVWLNLSENPDPLEAQIEPALLERFGSLDPYRRFDVGSLQVAHTITYDVHSNWKLIAENFMECYHCGPMHPELCRLLPKFKQGGSYQAGTGVGTRLAEDIEAFSMSGKSRFPRLPGLLPEDDQKNGIQAPSF